MRVTIIGGGLAGSEAAWQCAERGVEVALYEMRPAVMTPAHRTDLLAELVCSNSLKSNSMSTASGLLKDEMRRLDSLVMRAAGSNTVPAGDALAVDRDHFAAAVTDALQGHPKVTITREEVSYIDPDRLTVVASGPLTSDALSSAIASLTGEEHLYFYDAIAPTIDAESIDYEKVFRASRYGKGEEAYLNCPLDREQYDALCDGLVAAEKAPCREWEEIKFFEGCLPIEELAARGRKTLAFGPLKPVGLTDPKTGKRPYACVQLRQENAEATLYGLVGFQTRLRQPEQKRVFRAIPGLENAEFVRYGAVHRNTYVNSPKLLLRTLQLREHPLVLPAGQLTGVEGYLESASMGLLAGINAARLATGREPTEAPRESMMGSLASFLIEPEPRSFQPMNANFAILPPLFPRVHDKKERHARLIARAQAAMTEWVRGL
ncbi:MAG: methylenetetrahydrofolate--tRNA-(uracil(54)-C(5))-methyltransferase (FADH(2)-oxidizing) TrmFO [Armatimonadota bacterium]|nr:methylenetetrahydrofolate--tRNA-(uracil(54)-C(5))-methyltransferase (FADH(2)-oxidizing) TrmFO [Armatimonadota bacterium]